MRHTDDEHDHQYPPVPQSPIDAENVSIKLNVKALWAIGSTLVLGTLWAASQWNAAHTSMESVDVRLQRIEAHILRNGWTRQSMNVWTMEARRLNGEKFSAPNVNEIWEATQSSDHK